MCSEVTALQCTSFLWAHMYFLPGHLPFQSHEFILPDAGSSVSNDVHVYCTHEINKFCFPKKSYGTVESLWAHKPNQITSYTCNYNCIGGIYWLMYMYTNSITQIIQEKNNLCM